MQNSISAVAHCPPAGAGVHGWILATANRCRNAALTESEAECFIAERLTRPQKPANEIRAAIAKAYRTSPIVVRSGHRAAAARTPVPITEIQFDEAKLHAIASRIKMPANWRHWLWERSPKRPSAMNAFSFLAHLYRPGERVHIFDKFETKRPIATVNIKNPMDCRVPDSIHNGGRYDRGIWFLCNPVDGEWHDTGEIDDKGKPVLSCRNFQAVTSFRYAVLESDQVAASLWLAFIAQLPLRIAAIYSSGSRSLHCLIRIDAQSKAQWDSIIAPLKRPLKVLGADAGCLSAVRLTRLPQCWRPEKNGFQKLLYLCPNPPLAPLMDLPVLFSRRETLARWRVVCPRWNSATETSL